MLSFFKYFVSNLEWCLDLKAIYALALLSGCTIAEVSAEYSGQVVLGVVTMVGRVLSDLGIALVSISLISAIAEVRFNKEKHIK